MSRRIVTALVAGVLFGLGLGVSGMVRPTKVLAFLDVAGPWDPSLAFVMVGAIAVHAVAVVIARRRHAPLGASHFHWPPRTAVDARLVGGAALFGVGWGLGGFCPGPALTSAASGSAPSLVFVVAMVIGMVIHDARRPRIAAAPVPEQRPE